MSTLILRAMSGRDPDQSHRASTPLELFFDLICVVAIAAAANGLHHAVVADHVSDGLIGYLFAFASIWWAWMNFTWFASAYDNDDVLYRIAILIMMTGALILAAGISDIFAEFDWTLGVTGYIIMRLSLCSLWLRAAKHDPPHRKTAMRYAIGIASCQVLWIVGFMFVPESMMIPFWVFAMICELAVPAYAEQAGNTPWHREHIIERYGLFTIIVLGESLLAMSSAIAATTGIEYLNADLLLFIGGGLVIVFTMWWLYFSEVGHEALNQTVLTAFLWGYGHLVIFASAAAVGAGLAIGVDSVTDHAVISELGARFALSIPVAVFVLALWFVHERFNSRKDVDHLLYPSTAVLVLASTYLTHSAIAIGVILIACLIFKLKHQARRSSSAIAA